MNWRRPLIHALLLLNRRKVLSSLQEIRRLQRQGEAQMQNYQQEKLKSILWHAGRRVPYYRELLRETGVVAGSAVDLERFGEIPPLTKDVIREEGERLLDPHHSRRGSYENTSGGSTGEPVRLVQDRRYWDWNVATKLYFKTFGGQPVGEPEVRLWGSERDVLEGRRKLSIRLRDWLYNRTDINAFRMSQPDLERAVTTINRIEPTWIEGYVQSLEQLARYARAENRRLHRPRGVLTTAGVLTEQTRRSIEEAFGCLAFNRYGSREVGDMACSCPRQEGLHLAVWSHYLEVLDAEMNPVGPGETGSIHVTTLNNYSMPLIRYRIGDRACRSGRRCTCGRPMPLLERVVGRTVGVFTTAGGERVDGEFFSHLLYGIEWVRRFRVVQEDYTLVRVRIVPLGEPVAEDEAEIERKIRRVMGPGCRVIFDYVEQIPATPSGKYLYTISEVD